MFIEPVNNLKLLIRRGFELVLYTAHVIPKALKDIMVHFHFKAQLA